MQMHKSIIGKNKVNSRSDLAIEATLSSGQPVLSLMIKLITFQTPTPSNPGMCVCVCVGVCVCLSVCVCVW